MMCKKSIFLTSFMFVSCLLLTGITQAVMVDITMPGDTLKGVPDDGDWPGGEAPPLAIDDNIYTKYLHFKGDNQATGFKVTPSLGGMIVTGMSFTTGNDAPERDPVAFELYGSNTSIDGPYTLITSGVIVDFDQASPWPRNTKNATPITFVNAVAYAHYQVLFTDLRVWENGCCMQISEVELLTSMPAPAMGYYQDIGTSGGQAWQSGGSIMVKSDGGDIWVNADGFGFLYRPVVGDCIIEVDVSGFNGTHNWAKVGIMFRETLDPGSKHTMMAATGNNGLQWGWRENTDQGSGAYDERPGYTLPQKIRLVRGVGGNPDMFKAEYWGWIIPGVIEGWKSGTTWSAKEIPMDPQIYVGLSNTSHQNGALNTAQYDNVNWGAAANPYYKAFLPSPGNGAVRVDPNPTLTWMPGETAVSHHVWFDLDADGVLDYIGQQAETSYTPPGPLQSDTLYKWLITEEDSVGTQYPGDEWSFTVGRTHTGSIKREIWTGIGGVAVSNLTSHPLYPCCPTWSDEITKTDTPDLGLSDYGGRLIGYLWPENSGNYTFWIASDDASQLWLSLTDKGCDAQMLCEEPACCHGYDDTPQQKSAPVYLEGGQKYPIWILWKEGGGGDWCRVAWQGPDAPSRTEIDGYYLSPDFVDYTASNPFPPDGTDATVHEAETLSWQGVAAAAEYDVYFGTTSPPTYLATTADTSLSLEGLVDLALDTTYYWQVNTVNPTGPDPCEWQGCEWSFTTREWVSIDIGTVGGSSSYNPGTGEWTINADGYDIWENDDKFHYVYQTMEMTRDIGEITARVLEVPNTHDWSKVGVMIRESRANTSRHAFMCNTRHEAVSLQYRQQTGQGSGDQTQHPGHPQPKWVKLTREGDRFDGYWSNDGEYWTHRGTVNVPIESGKYVCIGIAVTSHETGVYGTGRVDNLSMSTPDPRKAWNPDPKSGAENVPLYLTLSWGAGDGATQHKVYFDGDPENLSLIATLPAEQTTLDIGPLLLDKKYYWRVNEVIINSDPCEITGDLWEFTTVPYLVVEDFESYVPVPPEPLPEQLLVGGDYWINPEEPDSAGLLAMYDFEGDANDKSGNGHDGTLIGDADVSTGVLKLGGDDCVDIGADPVFNFAGNFTLSAWVKLNNWGGCWGNVIVGKRGEGGVGWQLRRFGCDPRFSFTTRGMGNDDNPRSNLEPAMGEWYHLTAVRDGPLKLLYINGALDSTAGINNNPVNACDHNVYIGARANGGNTGPESYFNGEIDDLRIYNYALSEAEARYLADADPRYVPPEYGPLKAHYEFEGNYDDTSGNNKHLTPYGNINIVTDPVMGDVVSLPGGDNQYLGAGGVGISGAVPRTIAGWAKADHTSIPDWTLIFGFTLVGGCDQHFNVGSIGGPGGIGAHVWCWERRILSDQEGLDWHHYAMTYDGTTVKGYGDAILRCSGNRNLNTPDNFHIGSRATQSSSFPGDVDDVRVYDVELTQGQLVNLAFADPVAVETQNIAWEAGDHTHMSIDVDNPHSGNKAMFVYNIGTGGHLQKKFKPAADWTPGEPKALVMWYKGDPDVKEMYVQLENPTDDSPRVFPDTEVVDLKLTDWQELNFKLSDFSVDLDEVSKIIIKLKPEKWQRTDVYFDDIRLYPSRCVPAYGPYADLTGDCAVDNKDLRVLVADWLESDHLYTATDPGTDCLLAAYEFEGNADDVSGNGHDGTIYGDANVANGVLELDGDWDFVDIGADSVFNFAGNFSISTWVKMNSWGGSWGNVIVGKRGEGGVGWQLRRFGGDQNLSFTTRGIGNDDYPRSNISPPLNEWYHIAAVRDGTQKLLYINGNLDSTAGVSSGPVAPCGHNVGIGARANGDNTGPESFFDGDIDNLKIYDCALTYGEVLYLAGADPVYVPLVSPANIYDEEPEGSKKVNFKDYATMMLEWLLEQPWP
jgi:hypothetical protein